MDAIVCWDGDHIGREVGRAVLSDNIDQVRRVDQAIQAGNELWRTFALGVGGSIIEIGGDEGRILIGADHLAEVPKIAQQYAEAVGATCSVGVAMKLSESAKALMIAKLRGGNQIVIWDQEMQAQIDEATNNAPTEKDKLSEEYLGKGQLQTEGSGGPAPPSAPASQKQPKPVVPVDDPNVAQPAMPNTGSKDFESQLHDHAQTQGMQDDNDAADDDSHMDDVKAKVVETLTSVQKQMPLIQQLQATAPDVYASIIALVQGLCLLGKEVLGTDPEPEPEAPADQDAPPGGDPTAKSEKTRVTHLASEADSYRPVCKKRASIDYSITKDPAAATCPACRAASSTPTETKKDEKAAVAAKPVKSAPPLLPQQPTPATTVPAATGQNLATGRSGTNAHLGGGAQAGRAHTQLPPGTALDGKMKIRHLDGSAGWRNLLSGMIAGFEDSPLFGANSFPVSSRQPGKAK